MEHLAPHPATSSPATPCLIPLLTFSVSCFSCPSWLIYNLYAKKEDPNPPRQPCLFPRHFGVYSLLNRRHWKFHHADNPAEVTRIPAGQLPLPGSSGIPAFPLHHPHPHFPPPRLPPPHRPPRHPPGLRRHRLPNPRRYRPCHR